MSRATITDIARELGVSASTVSRALREHPDISEATRIKVREAAERLDYFPDSLAQGFKNQQTKNIGIIVPEIQHHFFSSAISGIEELAYDAGYTLMVCQSNEDCEREKINLRALVSNRVAGLLVSLSQSTTDISHFQILKKRKIPVVFFDRTHKEICDSQVVVNDYEGAYELVTHLIQRGYRRIAHIAGPSNILIGGERERGYRDALTDNGFDIDEALIVRGGYRKRDGSRGAEKLMELAVLPDAIFGVNDPVAIGAFVVLKERGIRIPEDIALAGFSNNPVSSLIDPPLTTVDQASYKIGRSAVELLLDHIRDRCGEVAAGGEGGKNTTYCQEIDMIPSELLKTPHRRFNPLTGEWLLLSPQRTQRPWQGRTEEQQMDSRPHHDPDCYLCPGNVRMQGQRNENYTDTFVFENDFKALAECAEPFSENENDLFRAESVDGTCRVICFSARHDLTLAEMSREQLIKVVDVWKSQTEELHRKYRWVQVFENKGEIMGCSNPHPHGQVWASDFIPGEPAREDRCQRDYLAGNGRNLLLAYLEKELDKKERIVAENDEWVCLVPYWAVWPFETLLVPRAHTLRLSELSGGQCKGLADVMKELLVRYDNIFSTSFPYSMGWHGAPADGGDNGHWQLHGHYYPPLLRSADIRKFMVGYEMLGCPQRDILPEQAAEMIRAQSPIHYKQREA